MMKQLVRFLAVLAVNFAGLGLGGWFTGPGVQSDWYAALPKAPWTPPGWVFGAAWTVVMIGFSWFAWAVLRACDSTATDHNRRQLTSWSGWLSAAWLLNVAWNPLFFTLHWVGLALVELISLLGLVAWLAWRGRGLVGHSYAHWGLLPYGVWLCIAVSLNAYSWLH